MDGVGVVQTLAHRTVNVSDAASRGSAADGDGHGVAAGDGQLVTAQGKRLRRNLREIAGIVRKRTHVRRNRRNGIHGNITSIVGKGTHVSGHRRDSWLVGQVVVILVPSVELRVCLGVAGDVARVVCEGSDIRWNRRYGIHGNIARIVCEGTHVGRNCWNSRLVDQVIVVLVPGVELRVSFGVAGDVARVVVEGTYICRHCRDSRNVAVGDISCVVRECTDIGRNSGDSRLVRQRVVVAVETSRQLHETAARQEERVVADAQHLLLSEARQVAGVVRKCTHIGGDSRNGWLVGEVIVVLVPGIELRVCFCIGGEITCVIIKCANVYGNLRNLREIGQVVIVAAEQSRFVENLCRTGGCVPVSIHLRGQLRRRNVAYIVGQLAHRRRDCGLVDQVIIASAQRHRRQIRPVGQRVVVSVEQRRLVGQVVVVAAEEHRFVNQIVIISAEQVRLVENQCCARCGAPVGIDLHGHLCLRDIARIVGESRHVGRHSRNGGLVNQVVIILVPRVVLRVSLGVVRDVTHIVSESRHVGRHSRNGGLVNQVVVVLVPCVVLRVCLGVARDVARIVREGTHV